MAHWLTSPPTLMLWRARPGTFQPQRMFSRILFAILLLPSFACLGKPGDRIEYEITIHEKVLANYQNLASGKTDTNQVTRFGNQYENRYHLSLSVTILSVENTYTLLRGNISVRTLELRQNN